MAARDVYDCAADIGSVIDTREKEKERAMSEVDVSFHAVEADEDHSTSQWEPIKAADHNHTRTPA